MALNQCQGGWFGEDTSDARWGADRRYVMDRRTGMPVSQHGFGDPVSKGWSRRTTAKQKLKKWAKHKTRGAWGTAKKDLKRVKQEHDKNTAKNKKDQNQWRQAKDIHTKDGDDVKRKAGPPPNGATATCRTCGYEIKYHGGHHRWEHTDKGNAECFGK